MTCKNDKLRRKSRLGKKMENGRMYQGCTPSNPERTWANYDASVRCTSGVRYTHTDHLGTPQLLTDSTANIVWQADYKPFGEASINPASTVTYNMRFPGQYADQETGLSYNYFRTYDPSTGRYVESDPIGLKAGLNTYAYVKNNPLMFIDPLGLRIIGLCDAGYMGMNDEYNRKNKEIQDQRDKDKRNIERDQTSGIAGCIKRDKLCRALKSYQCLPEEDCSFSYDDCLDNLYLRLDKANKLSMRRYQNNTTELDSRYPHSSPGSTASCPPIP